MTNYAPQTFLKIPPELRPEPEVIAADLNTAADYMQEHGWCRQFAEDSKGRVCVVGSLSAKHGLKAIRFNAALTLLFETVGESPAWWNDTVCKSKRQAVAALRRAARNALNCTA